MESQFSFFISFSYSSLAVSYVERKWLQKKKEMDKYLTEDSNITSLVYTWFSFLNGDFGSF